MATVTMPKITAEEFYKMDLGEGLHELVRGEIVEMPPRGPKHGAICTNSGGILRDFGLRTGHGYAIGDDSAVGINDYTVRGADVQYYSEARWPKAQLGDDPPPVPPDLVIEVYSPSNRPGKMMQKVADYLNAGVLMVWVLNPARKTLTIYRQDDADPITSNHSQVVEGLDELPGFRCAVADFFA